MPKTKYDIDSELLPYCFRLPKIPEAVVPILQKSLRLFGKVLLKDKKVEVSAFRLDTGVQMFMIKPKNSKTRKAIYDIHGGGFVFPHAPYHISLAKEYALRLDAKVFLIDYRLAPKYKYPVAPDDCFAGFEYLYKNKDVLDIDIENIIIGGDSAGSFLAVSTSLKMYEKYKFVPKGNLLIYPAVDTCKDTESMAKYTDTPMCNSRDADMYNSWFNNGKTITVMDKDLSVMPKTYIEVAEFDCLRDCGIAYAARLQEAGVETEFHDVKGTMHGFDFAMNAKITRKCVDNRVSFMRSLLTDKSNS